MLALALMLVASQFVQQPEYTCYVVREFPVDLAGTDFASRSVEESTTEYKLSRSEDDRWSISADGGEVLYECRHPDLTIAISPGETDTEPMTDFLLCEGHGLVQINLRSGIWIEFQTASLFAPQADGVELARMRFGWCID